MEKTMDKTTFQTENVGTDYTLLADLTSNKYKKANMQILSPEAKKLELAGSPDATQPMTVVPQGFPAATFDNYFPDGKIYGKVDTGTATVTINIW